MRLVYPGNATIALLHIITLWAIGVGMVEIVAAFAVRALDVSTHHV